MKTSQKLENQQLAAISIYGHQNDHTIKWNNLKQHPKDKRVYQLKPKFGFNPKDLQLLIWEDKSLFFIDLLIPQLVQKETFVPITATDIYSLEDIVKDILGIDIAYMTVMQVSYAGYEKIGITPQTYLDQVAEVDGFKLIQDVFGFKSFKNDELNLVYKIHNPLVTSWSTGQYTADKVYIKHEILYQNAFDLVDLDTFYARFENDRILKELGNFLEQVRGNIVFTSEVETA